MSFAVRLRSKRISLKMTQEELADRITEAGTPVTRNAVVFWENPHLSKTRTDAGVIPRPDTMATLAKVLNVAEEWLQYGKEFKNQPKDDIFSQKNELNSRQDFKLIGDIPKLAFKDIGMWLNSKQNILKKGGKMLEAEKISTFFQYDMDSDAMVNIKELEKSILPGETVIVDPSSIENIKTGDVVMACIITDTNSSNDDYKIRMLYKDGLDSYLVPLNTNYEKIKVTFPTYIIGKIINTIRKK